MLGGSNQCSELNGECKKLISELNEQPVLDAYAQLQSHDQGFSLYIDG